MNSVKEEETFDANDSNTQEYDGDLNDDLNAALSYKFAFTGSYYHRSIEQNAPNPGLTVDGVGMVGLPLGERDAQAIISRATQAPFGKGEDTVVDTKVRDTWEIDPSCIKFANPKWETFIDQISTQKVWTSLGVAPYATKPKCELYKLLLYQKGSHFLPHQDTAKAPGMFATVVVVLPSSFEGGEVHVSHSGRTNVLDVSDNSAFNTSVLAWYTDVVHEVKPITSGYRLALSYNLIHTSPNTPPPILPSTAGALGGLRETLERWNEDVYETISDPPLYAYVLDHQYSPYDLGRGVEALKGKDAQLIAHLHPILEELDFTLCFANLKKTEVGYADDCGYSYNKRSRWGGRGWYGRYDDYDDDDDDDDETPAMGEIEETRLELSNLVRISTAGPVSLGVESFSLDSESLVPPEAFDDLEPDDTEYEGYMGNGAGSLEQWYNRSAIVLFRKEDETSIIMDMCGATAVLSTLAVTTVPTPTAQHVVATVLAKKPASAMAVTLLGHALAWKQHETWNKAIPYVQPIDNITAAVTDALKVFSTDEIKPGLASLIKQQTGLQRRLDVTKAISAPFVKADDVAWAQTMTSDALLSYEAASPLDVPTLLRLAQEGGADALLKTVIPKTKKVEGTYDFHIALADAFRTLDKSSCSQQEKTVYSALIRECLLGCISQWKTSPVKPGTPAHSLYHYHAQPQAPSPTILKGRIESLVRLCLSLKDDRLCVEVFNAGGPTHQMDVLTAIRSHIGNTNPAWVLEPLRVALATYSTPALSDVPTLAWIAEKVGPGAIETIVSQRIAKSGSYEILMALAKHLHESSVKLSSSVQVERKAAFHRAIIQCIVSAIPQWEAGLYVTSGYAGGYGAYYGRPAPAATGPNAKVKRIIELLEFCFTIGDLSPCTTLFKLLLQISPNVKIADRFKELHTPLIGELKTSLKKHGKTVMLEPFRSFFKNAISLYLARILGVVTPPAQPPVFPTTAIGCGCSDCRGLDTWLKNVEPNYRFAAVQARRTHLEREIAKARAKVAHLITTDTLRHGSPHTLLVTKRPEIMAALTWKTSQAAAVAFVRKVADDKGLKELMPERYQDVLLAVAGKSVFVLGSTMVVAPAASISAAVPSVPASAVASTSASAGQGAGVVPPVAGAKRKQRDPPAKTIATIDLT